jgi:hypothetical protein
MNKIWCSILLGALILNIVNMSNLVLESPLTIHTSLQKSNSQNAFAESEDEEHDDENENEEHEDEGIGEETNAEETEDEIEDEDENDLEDGNEIETEDENDLEDGNEIETEDEIEDEDENDLEDDSEIETEDEIEETEIEVKITNDKTKVKIEQNGAKSKFLLETIDEKEVLKVISQKTGLTESQVQNIWDLEVESDSDESEHDAKIIQRKEESMQDAKAKIAALESHISELEQRVQALLEKLQSGQYYGNMESHDKITKSFNISFDGSAVSLQDESEDILSGEIFLDTKYTGQNISIIRVTGGEIIIGNTYYDMMFGKARISSSGPSSVKDTMILIGQVMDQEGNLNTLRLSIDAELPMDVDSGQKPISIQIDTPSKIAKQWSLKAAGTFSES